MECCPLFTFLLSQQNKRHVGSGHESALNVRHGRTEEDHQPKAEMSAPSPRRCRRQRWRPRRRKRHDQAVLLGSSSRGRHRAAYRSSTGEQPESTVAYQAARDAFIAAGGDPDLASVEVPRIIGAASQEHSDWFWRPASERIAQEEQRRAKGR